MNILREKKKKKEDATSIIIKRPRESFQRAAQRVIFEGFKLEQPEYAPINVNIVNIEANAMLTVT